MATSPVIFRQSPLSSVSDESDSSQIRLNGTQIRHEFKSPNACLQCNNLKVKCQYNVLEGSCKRCRDKGRKCIPRDRKKRKPAKSQEDLEEKSNKQDAQIQELLLLLEKLKMQKKARVLIANASSSQTIQTGALNVSAVNLDVFRGHEDPQFVSLSQDGLGGQTLPDLMKFTALELDEVNILFSIFFQRVNPYFSILDPKLHTPERLIKASPFLFTVICATAARYYTDRPNLHSLAQGLASDAARRALVDGSKSIDICQAYLLMGVYPVAKKKWVQDRSWQLMGVAVRMAIELGLNEPAPLECEERDKLNRTRTWLNCFCVEASHATQFGKLPMLRLDDFVARHSRDWYQTSSKNLPFDIHLCGYVDILKVIAQFRAAVEVESLTQAVIAIAMKYDTRLYDLTMFWMRRYDDDITDCTPICAYRSNTTRLIAAYLRVVVLSAGFQHAARANVLRDSELLTKSVNAARDVIEIMNKCLFPTQYLRYAMDANFLYVGFAAGFLIQLLRPEFHSLLDLGEHQHNIVLVQQLIEVLGSKSVALNGRHTPALYSRFLSSLLAQHQASLADSETETYGDPRNQAASSHSAFDAPDTSSYLYDNEPNAPPALWPDCPHNVNLFTGGLVPDQYSEMVQNFFHETPAQSELFSNNDFRNFAEAVYSGRFGTSDENRWFFQPWE